MKRFTSILAIAIGLAASLLAGPAAAQAANTATITFTAPTALADGSAIPVGSVLSYNVYQGEKGAAKTKVATISASPGSVTTGLSTGKAYCFQLSAVLNGLEGAQSNEACKSFVPPGIFTITVQ